MNNFEIPIFENAYFFFVYRSRDVYGRWNDAALQYLKLHNDDLMEIHIFSENSEYRAAYHDADNDFSAVNVTDKIYVDRYMGYADVINSFAFPPYKDITEENGIISFTDGKGRKKIVISSDVTITEATELKMLIRNFFPLISLSDGYRILSIQKKDGQLL